MTDPNVKLRSRIWRVRNSKWTLNLYLLFGLGTLPALLWVARKLQDRQLLRRVALYYGPPTALMLIAFGVSDSTAEGNDVWADIGATLTLSIWVVGMIHGVRLNRRLLLLRAQGGNDRPWYEQQAGAVPSTNSPHASSPSARTADAWSGRLGLADESRNAWGTQRGDVQAAGRAAPGFPVPSAASLTPPAAPAASAEPSGAAERGQNPTAAAPPSTPATAPTTSDALIDVNKATETQLRQLPNVGPALAKRILAHRDARGRLTGSEDLAAAGVPPHVLARVLPLVTFGRQSPQPTRARRLDI